MPPKKPPIPPTDDGVPIKQRQSNHRIQCFECRLGFPSAVSYRKHLDTEHKVSIAEVIEEEFESVDSECFNS